MKFFRKLLLYIILIILLITSILSFIGYIYYSKSMNEKSLVDRVSAVTSDEDFVKFDNLSKIYVDAVIAVEDHRFYNHGAVDFISIGRAFFTNLRKKELREGGSTITQQVAKNVCLSQEKSIFRKIAEFFASYDLEKNYSKNEIFELYVNTAYFGDGYYGIKQASKGYYDKTPDNLTLYEASMLAGVPNAPSVYAPTKNPDLAKQRQAQVLRRMLEYNYINQEEFDSIITD